MHSMLSWVGLGLTALYRSPDTMLLVKWTADQSDPFITTQKAFLKRKYPVAPYENYEYIYGAEVFEKPIVTVLSHSCDGIYEESIRWNGD